MSAEVLPVVKGRRVNVTGRAQTQWRCPHCGKERRTWPRNDGRAYCTWCGRLYRVEVK